MFNKLLAVACILSLNTLIGYASPSNNSIENVVKEFTSEQRTMVQSKMVPNSPISVDDLRMVYVGFWGVDNREHQGTIITNKSVADDVCKVFQALDKEKFPIRRMDAIFGLETIEGNNLSLYEQDNTVSFHSRKERFTTVWSQHAYGLAVDVNPAENPYIGHGSVEPPAGKDFTDRNNVRPGMITHDSAAYKAFTDMGWKWGGDWHDPKDYMHFSKTGH